MTAITRRGFLGSGLAAVLVLPPALLPVRHAVGIPVNGRELTLAALRQTIDALKANDLLAGLDLDLARMRDQINHAFEVPAHLLIRPGRHMTVFELAERRGR